MQPRWTWCRTSSSGSATTPSGWTAFVPAASSSPADWSSVRRCNGPSSKPQFADRSLDVPTDAQFPLVLGLDTFGDISGDPAGPPRAHAQTMRNVGDEGVLGHQAGVDFFGFGEHQTDARPGPAARVLLCPVAARP